MAPVRMARPRLCSGSRRCRMRARDHAMRRAGCKGRANPRGLTNRNAGTADRPTLRAAAAAGKKKTLNVGRSGGSAGLDDYQFDEALDGEDAEFM